MKRDFISAEELRHRLLYDPETGVFIWAVHPMNGCKAKPGKVAGTRGNGYIQISLSKVIYKAHRLAWLYVHGSWPADEIDHINGDRGDNKISNLREATRAQNMQNAARRFAHNTSGQNGVSWYRKTQSWRADIKLNRKQIYLGSFHSFEDACAVFKRAKTEMHPFNARPL